MKKKLYLSPSAYLIFLLFIILAGLSVFSPYFGIDLSISRSVQSIHFFPFDLLMRVVSSVGSGRAMPFTAILILSLIAYLNLRVEAIYLATSSIITMVAGWLTKSLINRPRPDEKLVSIYKHLSDKSFPSSHTLIYTVIFGFIFFVALTRLKPSIGRNILLLLSSLLILTIGLSRIYLGAHWASDVLGGYLFGAFCLILTINIYKANVQR